MRGFAIAIFSFLLLGIVAAIGYQAGLSAGPAAGAAGTAVAPYPYWHPGFFFFPFGFLFPLLFLFLIFGLVRAAFGGGHWGGRYGRWGSRMDEWHHEMHEREKNEPPKAGI